MNTQTCIFEHQVVTAVKTGQWTDELHDHAKTCSLCSESIVVTSALHRIVQKTSGEVKTVAYYILWFRAQFVRKQGHLSKVDRYMLVALFGIAFFFLIGIILWKWQVVQASIMSGSSESASNLPIYIASGSLALVWFLTEEVLHEGK